MFIILIFFFCSKKAAPLVFKEESNVVLEGISLVRKEIQGLLGQSGELVNKSVYVINTGIAHSSGEYLLPTLNFPFIQILIKR